MWVRSAIGVGLLCGVAQAQETATIGRVRVEDAQVAGTLEVSGGEALLRGSAMVTARDRTAELWLERGGEVQVCQTSVLHVTIGPQQPGMPAPLLLGLDRGAMQVHTAATVKDALLTPDLRFSVTRAGLLNLGIRVVRNGDTCVENSGAGAPTLAVEEQLTGSSYELRPGQHVLFERGSVREVVDHETSPCGCPPVTPPQELAGTGGGGMVVGGSSPAAGHPFPAAESEGLVPSSEVPQAPPGQVHAQVGATLAYGEAGTDSGGGMTPAPAVASTSGSVAGTPARAISDVARGSSTAVAGVPPVPGTPRAGVATSAGAGETRLAAPAPTSKSEQQGGVFQRIGRFFKRLLG